jgi:hypothetical protein
MLLQGDARISTKMAEVLAEFWQRNDGRNCQKRGAEMAAAFTRALGHEVRYNAMSPGVYRSLGFPVADNLRNMFQFKHDFNDIFCGARNVDLARALNPSLQTFDAWLAQNASRIPLEEP